MIIRWKQVLRRWIPGIISGGADNDPSGIATYAISGAMFGFAQLWLLLLSTPMVIAVQAMCARLGDVKQKGLMSIIREHYSPMFAVLAACILIITNTVTLGADLTAMADAVGLITKTPYVWWVIPISFLIWIIVVFVNFRVLERYLFFLTFLFLSYVVSGFLAQPNWMAVLQSIAFPAVTFSPSYIATGLAVLGTTITPYLFFWQTKEEVEEHKQKSEQQISAKKEDGIVAPGFVYSNTISFFVIVASATALYGKGSTGIVSAADAARALEPFVGSFAQLFFAIGIIGAGLLAVPVLSAATAYVVAETFGWRDSLSDKPNRAKGFYAVLTASIFVGVAIALSGMQPMAALFYSQVLNGILAPVLIIMIILLCNNRILMGKYVNRLFDNIFGWLAALIMIAGSASLLYFMVK